jgi:hypothetical protein
MKDIREVNSNREFNRIDLSNEWGWYEIGYGYGKWGGNGEGEGYRIRYQYKDEDGDGNVYGYGDRKGSNIKEDLSKDYDIGIILGY